MNIRESLIGAVILSITLCAVAAEAQDWSCTNCISDLAAGGYHGCATRDDGTVTCWGRDGDGQSTPPELDPDMYDFLEVSSGLRHTCARIKCTATFPAVCPLGNIRCWGLNDVGQTSVSASTVYKSIDAGGYHSCGLTSGNDIECWGWDDDGQSTVPPPPAGYRYSQVSAGIYHTCATLECESGLCLLRTNVVCWGGNGYGQTDVPGTLPDYHTFTQITAGGHHTCGVKTDGTVLCWGANAAEQSTPPAGTFQEVSAGSWHTCGLRTDGTIACWGADTYGQSTPPTGKFVGIATTGEFFSCGMRPDRSVVCWGDDEYNQTLPTAGRCGLFDADFEVGGDCRWSNGSVPCWTADCDGDGYVSDESTTICSATMPMLLPPDCLGGDWVQATATCGAFDCKDDNPDVFTGRPTWNIYGYSAGGPSTLMDYNCDGVEEKRYTRIASNVCCSFNGESCVASSLPGCDLPGWDADTVSEVPGCAEVANYRWCIEFAPGMCTEQVEPVTQVCR